MGITETEKMIQVLRNLDISALMAIDLSIVKQELSDLDREEALKIAHEIFDLVCDLISALSVIRIVEIWKRVLDIIGLIRVIFRA